MTHTWCPRCGHPLQPQTSPRGTYQCDPYTGCGLNTDTPLASPRLAWVRRSSGGGRPGWRSDHAGYHLDVVRVDPGEWRWHLADDHQVLASGTAGEYRYAQRKATGALAFELHQALNRTLRVIPGTSAADESVPTWIPAPFPSLQPGASPSQSGRRT